jgi:hypothetical protein
MRLAPVFLLAVSALTVVATGFSASAQEPARSVEEEKGKPQIEILREWGAYYSSVGLYIPVSDDPFPDGGQMTEWEVYRQLFERSYRPNVLILEASVYPMPALGVWLRGHRPGLYDSANLGGGSDLNVVQAVTAGFQEPWAASIFFGSQMKFSRPGETERATNRGYMGYLVSAGKKHIKENVLIDDDWVEVEWKMKGERKFEEDRLSWSFRVGGKFNRNGDIADTVYLGIIRSSLDFKSPFLSFLDNSRLSLFTEIPTDGLVLLRQEIVFGKKYPVESARMAWELDFGLIYERATKYSGPLAPLAKTSYTLVFRPNIVF